MDMDYLKFINCKKEPFARTPDPDLFSRPQQLMTCLVKMENSIRTRRGLNLILGEVGVGKTALCQQLVRRLDKFERTTFVLTGPQFNSPREFLARIAELIGQFNLEQKTADSQFEEELMGQLAEQSADKETTFVLIIDDGHKLPEFCFDILRRFLAPRDDRTSLLQVVIFAHKEFEKKISLLKNVASHISHYQTLQPLNFRETRELVQFRLYQASEEGRPPSVFNFPGMWAIYRFTDGNPGKVVDLCRLVIMTMIIRGRKKAGWLMIHSCANRILPEQARSLLNSRVATMIAMVMIAIAFFGLGGMQPLFKGPLLGIFQQAALQVPGEEVIIDDRDEPPFESDQDEFAPADASNDARSVTPEIPEVTLTAVLEKAIDRADEKVGKSKPAESLSSAKLPLVIPEPVKTAKPAPPPEKIKTAAKVKEPSSKPGTFPDILGEITVQKGETLGDMISKTYGYGSFTKENTKRVLDVNPHIKNPGMVSVGDVFHFPTFGVKASPGADKLWWVQLATRGRLDESYRFVAANYNKEYRMFIIPTLNSQGGLQFTIILSKAFANQPSAEKVVSRLPKALAADVIYLEGLSPDRYYYDTKE